MLVRGQMKRSVALVAVLVLVTSAAAAMLIQTRSYSLAPCIVGVRELHCGGPFTDYRIALRLAVAGMWCRAERCHWARRSQVRLKDSSPMSRAAPPGPQRGEHLPSSST